MTNRANSPGEHPFPPADLAQRELPIICFGQGTIFYRVHQAQYNPIYFGRSGRGRFDAPRGEYGILYAATDQHCAFRETVGRFSQYRLLTLPRMNDVGFLLHRDLRRPIPSEA